MAKSEQKTTEVTPFASAPGHPLAAEHALVTAWTEAATASLDTHSYYQDVDLKSLPEGKAIFDAKPDAARRIVLAAVEQVVHWDAAAAQVRNQGKTEMERVNAHFLPGWGDVWGRRRKCETVVATLMRRSLPLVEADLLALLSWCNRDERLSTYSAPIGSIVRALERFASGQAPGEPLRQAMATFAGKLRASHEKEVKRLGTTVEQLLGNDAAPQVEDDLKPSEARPLTAVAAGNPAVLVQLKEHLGLLKADSVPTTELLPDRFQLRDDSALKAEHAALSEVLSELIGKQHYYDANPSQTAAGRKILASEPAALGRFALAAAERAVSALLFRDRGYADTAGWQSRAAAQGMARSLIRADVQFDRDGLFDCLLFLSTRSTSDQDSASETAGSVLEQVEAAARLSPLSEGERYALSLWRASRVPGPLLGAIPAPVARLNTLIGDGMGFYLAPDEEWSTALNHDIHAMPTARRAQWVNLFKHWLTATAARPSDKWLKTATKLVNELGEPHVVESLVAWLARLSGGRATRGLPAYAGDTRSGGDTIQEENAVCLRGMLWTMPRLKGQRDALTRVIATVAQSAYRKIPGVGPRAVKVGNAAVYALSEMGTSEAVGQLAMLKVRVKFGTAQKEIEKAFTSAAQALGLPRDQIEEMGVPTYGLEEVGVRRETFGEFGAELRVDGRQVAVTWTGPGGKALKAVPAKVKADHKEELKELQSAAKDIAAMLPAQGERLDAMFLAQATWPHAVWRERYLDHPLIGTLARRLIWAITQGGTTSSAIWHDGNLVDAHDAAVEPSDGATIALWHPIDRPTDEVLAWRSWLVRHEVRQPFKQAHRELYPLTDAERRTATYSNRFAAHVLRQHQFNALCAARGWKNKLRLMVDDSYPPASRDLPQWRLRAEYWIEGIGDEYGVDTNDSGAYLRVATDQVRFYRTAAAPNFAHAGGGGYAARAAGPGQGNVNEPLPLTEVPPLVLSEILRDVDLFVGVASVGNDPTWQDGGPNGRYQAYWRDYSFGDLSETAKTRKAVLQSLLPRLSKIRDRCHLDEKFLVVRGDLRTYRIHLGSGNILMEPNDQYLCIIPDASARKQDDVFLPFEGDATLSIILSKAFLLAADTKITDSTITRQIRAK